MGARKLGLYVDAEAPVGRVEVVELGVPICATAGAGAAARSYLLDRGRASRRCCRAGRPSAHKGSAGPPAGRRGLAGKTGAAVLVGQAGAARGRRARDGGVDGAPVRRRWTPRSWR